MRFIIILDTIWQFRLVAKNEIINERNTCAKIGILIAMAAIIGKSMLDSGAAERIIRAMLKVTGEKHSAIGFILSSFFLLCMMRDY